MVAASIDIRRNGSNNPTASEEYAVAKMRLFQASDEGEIPLTAETAREARLVLDESNLESLLRVLNI